MKCQGWLVGMIVSMLAWKCIMVLTIAYLTNIFNVVIWWLRRSWSCLWVRRKATTFRCKGRTRLERLDKILLFAILSSGCSVSIKIWSGPRPWSRWKTLSWSDKGVPTSARSSQIFLKVVCIVMDWLRRILAYSDWSMNFDGVLVCGCWHWFRGG